MCNCAVELRERHIYIYYHHEEYLTVFNKSLNYNSVTLKLLNYNVLALNRQILRIIIQ